MTGLSFYKTAIASLSKLQYTPNTKTVVLIVRARAWAQIAIIHAGAVSAGAATHCRRPPGTAEALIVPRRAAKVASIRT